MTGYGVFLRSCLHRDRMMLPWWVIGCTLLYWSQAASVKGLYTTQAQFDAAARNMEHNSAFVAMAGPARALNTIGGQVTWQASAFGAIVAGLMSMFVIARHTRAEEESGRDELIRSGVVGRHAPMAAALTTSLLANAVMAACVSLSLIGYGLAVPGALALGTGLLGTGAVFSAVALLAAQLTDGTRTMYGITGAVIGASYALRAIGDVSGNGLSWLSPIGWYQAMHAYSGERWWPLVLLAAASALVLVASFLVFGRRDIGAGVFQSRPGPARAPRGLAGDLGLAWRLQRGSIVGWSLGLFLGGLGYGSIGSDVGTLIGDSKFAKDVFVPGGGSLVDAFYASAALMLTLIACGYSISAALRARGEEDAGHLESLLATGLSRRRWLAGQVVVTVGGLLAVMALAGLGLGIGYAAATGDGSAVARLCWAVLSLMPGALVLTALTRLVYGLRPRLASVAWLPLAFCVVVMFFGAVLRFPQWLTDLSPFSHLALVPAVPVDWTPFGLVLAFAVVFSLTGQWAFTRRDAG